MRYKFDGDNKYFDLFSGIASYNIDGNGIQVYDIVATTTTIAVTLTGDGANPAASGNIYYRIYAEPKL